MSNPENEKPLPKPPHTAFGRKKPFEQTEEQTLMADRLAAAAVEGRLEEFLNQEIPDNEYARNLASMMMGMTGMMPGHIAEPPRRKEQPEPMPAGAAAPGAEVPEEIRAAAQSGDVKVLRDLLRQEHRKRMPDAVQEEPCEPAAPQPATGLPAIDKDLIDALIRIAGDNSVTLDWLILRAIKVYVQEYQKTGRL
jgi:hypothetical protein